MAPPPGFEGLGMFGAGTGQLGDGGDETTKAAREAAAKQEAKRKRARSRRRSGGAHWRRSR